MRAGEEELGGRGMKRWQSNAEWLGEIRTKDTHDSKEEADGVCRRLMRDGYGEDGDIFPLRVWVSEHELSNRGIIPSLMALASSAFMQDGKPIPSGTPFAFSINESAKMPTRPETKRDRQRAKRLANKAHPCTK